MIGGGLKDNAGMWGGGFGLRFRPMRAFGIEAGLDFLGGRDYQGFQRDESAFSVSGLFYANPESQPHSISLRASGGRGLTQSATPVAGAWSTITTSTSGARSG